jgi:glycosyltransferase involved in cell wall biosynthesis
MAMGMPSVCSAIDGNLEAVDDGETGLIFPVDNDEILADRLLVLIANEELRKEMGEKARERAKEKFDMRKLARAYEELYVDMIRINSRRRLRDR